MSYNTEVLLGAGSTVTVTTTSETTVLTSAAISDDLASAITTGVKVNGFINVTAGTAATLATIRVREGSGTGGTLVYETEPFTVAAGSEYQVPYEALDATGFASGAGAQWTVTIQFTAATGNSTVNGASINVSVN